MENVGCVFNNYNPCAANELTQGKQMMVHFHVDNAMSSHVESSVNDEFTLWLNEKCREMSEAMATRGKAHDYPGMTFGFIGKELEINMVAHIKGMLKNFPIEFRSGGGVTVPAGFDSFKADTSEHLSEEGKEMFHQTVVQSSFSCEKGGPDMGMTTSVPCSGAQEPGRKEQENSA